ncbi:hypothetical protein GW17_00028314 [Ensete ventricosum]|nr:hypothetical protein GW17_00028314 [Ensete ventricosum]
MNRRGEPGIGEQPPVPVRGQGRLSPVCGPQLGSRGCSHDLRHGHGGENHPGEDSRVRWIAFMTSWSYVSHVVAIIPNKPPTAYRRGHCTLVDCCVCLGMPLVASCQGSGGTVRRSAAASTLTHCLSPAVRGQGVLFACRLLRLP